MFRNLRRTASSLPLLTLYGLNVGNDDYLDSVHTSPLAWKYTQQDEDTIIEMKVPEHIASLLFKDGFRDGYERYNFVKKYITKRDV